MLAPGVLIMESFANIPAFPLSLIRYSRPVTAIRWHSAKALATLLLPFPALLSVRDFRA